MKLLALNFNHR